MRRRDLLVLAAGSLIAPLAPGEGHAMHRIGFIALNDSFSKQSPLNFVWRAIEQSLAREGFGEGRNLVIERRHASGKPAGLAEAASQLAALEPEVIAAFASQAINAARAASRDIPIVGYTSDAVALGYAKSYARPGGRITGVSPSTLELTVKQLELLAAFVPDLRRVAWLRNGANQPFVELVGKVIDGAAAQLHVAAAAFDASSGEALDGAVAEIVRQGYGAVLVPGDILYIRHRERIGALLLDHRLPSASFDRLMLKAGILLTIGVDVEYAAGRMGIQIAKILNGTPAGEIPFDFIGRFQTGINLKTARVLGLTVPTVILLRADEVIK
jgi:putative ABC transport system substrate-binding protein